MSLDRDRKELELMRVKVAAMELEFKVKERLADIDRLKENINAQEKRIIELEAELKE